MPAGAAQPDANAGVTRRGRSHRSEHAVHLDDLDAIDLWMLSRFHQLVSDATESFSRYAFQDAIRAIDTALAQRYAGSKYVSVMPSDHAAFKSGKLEPEALNETNRLELYVFASDKHRQAVLVARLDNLGKGASGAAVQNMRLMLGYAEP